MNSIQTVSQLKRIEEGAVRYEIRDPLVPTIFHEPWWLEAASGGQYDEVTVSSGGRTVGRLPFMQRRRLGFNICEPPELTHFLGPAVDEGNGGIVSRNLRRGEITRHLIEKLPSFHYFTQWLHRDVPDALPFIQHNFTVQAAFTYEVAPTCEKTIWRNMRDKTRNVIRRAEEQTGLVDLEPAHFFALYEANLQRRGKFFNYMLKTNAQSVFEAALSRGRGRLLGAQAADGTIMAAIFYVWDQDVTYYMLTTRAPDTHNGVVSRLIWEAMRETAANGRTFDFGGVGTAGSVLFYTAFGGEVSPRYTVHRTTPVFGCLRSSVIKSRDIIQNMKVLRST
jgi:CelD/BcsL family acetyltransferase involved in cellulose biosynthesis